MKQIPFRHRPKGLTILYEDKDIIVIDKSAGLLTVKATYEKEKTARHILTTYIRKGSLKSQKELFVVHRLDRDTSGVLVFAKSFEAKESLKLQWKNVKKKYVAVVHGILTETRYESISPRRDIRSLVTINMVKKASRGAWFF